MLAHFCANLSKTKPFLTARVTLRILRTECQGRGDNRLNGENMERDDRLMTVKELAAYLNLNERTVLKLAADGPMPAVKVGNQWRFWEGLIDAWVVVPMIGGNRRSAVPPRAARAGGRLVPPPGRFVAPPHLSV